MKHQDIDSFDINNGKSEHVTRKQKNLFQKTLLDILAKYYKEDTKKAESEYLYFGQSYKVKDMIVRKLDKS